jgi:hypothetical protein
MDFLSWDSQVEVPKSPKLGLLRLWSPITLRSDLRSKCSLKQSCSSCRELSNDMWHALCQQVNWVDSRLLVVGSQTGNLTLGPSFAHNLCFKCPNEQCEPILDIYAPRDFQKYKEPFHPWSFDPWNLLLKIWESTGTPTPKVELPWECEGSLPLTLLHSWEHAKWLPGSLLARNLTTALPWSWA